MSPPKLLPVPVNEVGYKMEGENMHVVGKSALCLFGKGLGHQARALSSSSKRVLHNATRLFSAVMRPRHTQHSLPSFPIYSCAFLTPLQVVLGGGGGASKSGIKNKLVIRVFGPVASY